MAGNFTSVIFWALPTHGAMVLGAKLLGPSGLGHLYSQDPSGTSTVLADKALQNHQWLTPSSEAQWIGPGPCTKVGEPN